MEGLVWDVGKRSISNMTRSAKSASGQLAQCFPVLVHDAGRQGHLASFLGLGDEPGYHGSGSGAGADLVAGLRADVTT